MRQIRAPYVSSIIESKVLLLLLASGPSNDRIKSAVFEYSDVKISDLARRTFELALNK